jgi:hypothetical protein
MRVRSALVVVLCAGFAAGAAAPADRTSHVTSCGRGLVLTVGSNREYPRITDALAAARRLRLAAGELERARTPVCIDVAAGTYVGSFDPAVLGANPGYEALPLVLDVPNVSVRGVTELVLDERNRPLRVGANVTRLVADPPAADNMQPYFLVAPTERQRGLSIVRSRGNRATIEGFVLDFAVCGAGGGRCAEGGRCEPRDDCRFTQRGTGIWTHGIDDYLLRGNVAIGGGYGVQHSFSSGRTIRNLLMHNALVGIVYRGPARTNALVRENTSTHNSLGGMAVACSAGNFPLPALDHEPGVAVVPGPVDGSLHATQVELDTNDFSHHTGAQDFSFGLRILMFGPQPLTPDRTTCRVTAQRNRMIDTTFGIVNDAGFPYATVDGRSVGTAWTARYRASYRRNEVDGDTEDVLVSLTRFTSTRDCRELDSGLPTSFRFLRQSTYSIRHSGELGTMCRDNRELDPATREPLGNELRVGRVSLEGLTCKPITPCAQQ